MGDHKNEKAIRYMYGEPHPTSIFLKRSLFTYQEQQKLESGAESKKSMYFLLVFLLLLTRIGNVVTPLITYIVGLILLVVTLYYFLANNILPKKQSNIESAQENISVSESSEKFIQEMSQPQYFDSGLGFWRQRSGPLKSFRSNAADAHPPLKSVKEIVQQDWKKMKDKIEMIANAYGDLYINQRQGNDLIITLPINEEPQAWNNLLRVQEVLEELKEYIESTMSELIKNIILSENRLIITGKDSEVDSIEKLLNEAGFSFSQTYQATKRL